MKNFKDNYHVGNHYSIYVKGSAFECMLSQREEELGVRYIVATYGNLKQRPMYPHFYGRQVNRGIRKRYKA